jgi:hypothetical protein
MAQDVSILAEQNKMVSTPEDANLFARGVTWQHRQQG